MKLLLHHHRSSSSKVAKASSCSSSCSNEKGCWKELARRYKFRRFLFFSIEEILCCCPTGKSAALLHYSRAVAGLLLMSISLKVAAKRVEMLLRKRRRIARRIRRTT
jgi:hypothetical protein